MILIIRVKKNLKKVQRLNGKLVTLSLDSLNLQKKWILSLDSTKNKKKFKWDKCENMFKNNKKKTSSRYWYL